MAGAGAFGYEVKDNRDRDVMSEPRIVKRYARTRLYDTAAARYVTIGDLRAWLAAGVMFVVIDTETGDDVTRVLLA